MAESDKPVHLLEREGSADRFLIYSDARGPQVELRYHGDALWMSQAQMSELFGRDVSVVSRHIANILEEGELDEATSLQKLQTSPMGRPGALYSLDMVISVGYRVSSVQATLFRRWATATLVRFATSGFVVDVERLKAPDQHDRVAELRDIIRDIRSSEANLYAELRRICALCQDYDSRSPAAHDFYRQMQAKLVFAVTSQTPSEVLASRADANTTNMGLQTWPKAEIRKSDAIVSKNYLGPPEIRELNRLTTILLDIFEDQLEIGRLTTMAHAHDQLDQSLSQLNRSVLRGGGQVSRDAAERRAVAEYERFDADRKKARQVAALVEIADLKQADEALPKSPSGTRRSKR